MTTGGRDQPFEVVEIGRDYLVTIGGDEHDGRVNDVGQTGGGKQPAGVALM